MDKTGSDCAIALLHHDLIRAFNTYLNDNAIPAHALFQDEMIRELDGTAERSVFDMMNFAVHLYDYTVTHLLELADSENVISKVKRSRCITVKISTGTSWHPLLLSRQIISPNGSVPRLE